MNKKGFPVLPKSVQSVVKAFFALKVQFIIEGRNVGHDHLYYQQYLDHMVNLFSFFFENFREIDFTKKRLQYFFALFFRIFIAYCGGSNIDYFFSVVAMNSQRTTVRKIFVLKKYD